MSIREDASRIIEHAIRSALPDAAVRRALESMQPAGRLYAVAVGKAAWQMANAASELIGDRLQDGIVITKHGYSGGPIPGFRIFEAGHPVPDEDTYAATDAVIAMTEPLTEEEEVIFLISGGGSALFEKPLIPPEDLDVLTKELLSCGADITEINTMRKRFSAVKGGRFAQLCSPARIHSVVLSDVLGDRLDTIASGPAYPDSSTSAEAIAIAEKYNLTLTEKMRSLLNVETPKTLDNVETAITGSVSILCASAAEKCRELGYRPVILTSSLSCTARDAGVFLSNIAQEHYGRGEKLAFLAGGETVVRLTGTGLGGRNQELALAAAPGIRGMENVCVFSVGSDGTDGPTDAAGGIVDGSTCDALAACGLDVFSVLQENDSYHALEKCGGLLKTGPTGTNVNDLSVLLLG